MSIPFAYSLFETVTDREAYLPVRTLPYFQGTALDSFWSLFSPQYNILGHGRATSQCS